MNLREKGSEIIHKTPGRERKKISNLTNLLGGQNGESGFGGDRDMVMFGVSVPLQGPPDSLGNGLIKQFENGFLSTHTFIPKAIRFTWIFLSNLKNQVVVILFSRHEEEREKKKKKGREEKRVYCGSNHGAWRLGKKKGGPLCIMVVSGKKRTSNKIK